MRRVQALETSEGVTVLSNRIRTLPEARISDMMTQKPRDRTSEAPPAEDEAVALASEAPSVTETRSLRPSSSRTAKAKNASRDLGWLLWPFVLFVTTGAVVGTLWFRKKTQ